MTVLITGATGFVGSHVVRALLQHEHRVRALSRHANPKSPFSDASVEHVQGDVTDPSSLHAAVEGCDAVVHLVGIIDERPRQDVTFQTIHERGTHHVVEAAKEAGVTHFIHMSANNARPHARSPYLTTKWQAEQYVKGAGFDHWTIFRPSIIFGDPGAGNTSFEVRLSRQLIDPYPILPVFGDGTYRLQPVSVEAVADAFAQAVDLPAAHGQTYEAAGPTTHTYNEVLDVITQALGFNPKPKLHLPLWLGRALVYTLGRLGLLPISPAQLEMLVEGNTCDPTTFYRDFDVHPVPFSPENLPHLSVRA